MRNGFFALAIAAAALSSACSSQKLSVTEKKVNAYHTAGAEALNEGRYNDALAALTEAARLNPKGPGVFTDLGVAYLGKGEVASAEESFRRALAIDPKWTDARANLGALYLHKNRLKDAESQLQLASRDLTYGKSHLVDFNLAAVYAAWRKPLLQERHLRKALATDPNYCSAWFQLGKLQRSRNQIELAAASYRKSVAGTCYKANPEAHYEIATLLIKNNETEKARARLLDMIQFFPSSDWARKAEITLNMIR